MHVWREVLWYMGENEGCGHVLNIGKYVYEGIKSMLHHVCMSPSHALKSNFLNETSQAIIAKTTLLILTSYHQTQAPKFLYLPNMVCKYFWLRSTPFITRWWWWWWRWLINDRSPRNKIKKLQQNLLDHATLVDFRHLVAAKRWSRSYAPFPREILQRERDIRLNREIEFRVERRRRRRSKNVISEDRFCFTVICVLSEKQELTVWMMQTVWWS